MTPLLIPGNMCDARLWPHQLRAVLPGAVDCDVTIDCTIEAMALRALESTIGPLLPVGFSMGGIVALAMAKFAPERLTGLVLLDTNASADLPERARERPRQQAEVRAGRMRDIVVDELKPNYLASANRGDKELLNLLLDMALDVGEEAFVRQSEALRTRPDLRDALKPLQVPVLLACGAEDQLCPPAWHEELARSAACPTLCVIPGAGHMLPLEQPAPLAAGLSGWLKEAFH